VSFSVLFLVHFTKFQEWLSSQDRIVIENLFDTCIPTHLSDYEEARRHTIQTEIQIKNELPVVSTRNALKSCDTRRMLYDTDQLAMEVDSISVTY
jgi:hypothetical protein